jgi:hypothetical protein
VRVVYQPDADAEDIQLVDVPRDGKTLGEIVTRGNIVMKEVCRGGQYIPRSRLTLIMNSISVIPKPLKRHSGAAHSDRVTWPLCTRTALLPLWIEARTLLYLVARCGDLLSVRVIVTNANLPQTECFKFGH